MQHGDDEIDQPNLVSSRGFLQSARDLGLTTADAVCELIDNGLDAGANNIWVSVTAHGDYLQIRVLDDGLGIPMEIRAEDGRRKDGIGYALSFGGRPPGQAVGTTIGKFGWGLSSAACCQSLRTDVYSKQRNERSARYCYLDLDELESQNSIQLPRTTIEEPSGDLAEQFLALQSGTLVSLSRCDNPDYKTASKVKSSLEAHLGMKYRRFLGAGRAMWVGGSPLVPRDPLFMTPGCYDSDKIPLAQPYSEIPPIVFPEIPDQFGQPSRITIRIVCLEVETIRRKPEWSGRWMKDRGLNEENQGFYLMRNDRQIAEAQTLGLFTRNASLNYFRGEISFPPSLDKYFGIQTNKNRFTLKDSVKEQIETSLGPVIGHITNETRSTIDRLTAEQQLAEQESKGPTPGEKIAAEASKLLKVRPGMISEEAKHELDRLDKEHHDEIQKISENQTLDPKQKEDEIQAVNVKFEMAKLPYHVTFSVLGDGNFYNAKFRGRQAQVLVNKDHPFFAIYERATQVPEQRILLDLLLQSAVHAEGMYDGNRDMTAAIAQFRREWSIALKVFLEKKEEVDLKAEGLEP